MKVTLIHNPKSGGRTHDGSGLTKLIRRAGHEVTYVSSKEMEWERALEEPANLVAVAGGDGTVGKVARQLVGRDTPFTILPTGTANNVAKTFGLTEAGHADLVAGWTSGKRSRLDVGVVTGPMGTRAFVEGFGLGLFADTMARLGDKESPERDRLAAARDEVTSVRKILAERLSRHPSNTLAVILDGRDLSGEYVLLEAMNTNYIGPNLHLAPGADPGDGLLDLVLLPESERERLSAYLAQNPNGQLPGLGIYRGKCLRIEWDQSDAHVDDELWSRESQHPREPCRVDIVLDPHGLQFLSPAR